MTRLVIRVQPGARRTAFVGWYGDIPKMSVAAPPVDGAANDELIRSLARELGVRRRGVHLVGGARSRTKRFEIDGLGAAELAARLGEIVPKGPAEQRR